jgi:ComF family protein
MLKSLLNILFPKVCSACNTNLSTGETTICIQCRHILPLVRHHKDNSALMKNMFYGRIDVQLATALLKFEKKGITQELLHNLKYRNQEGISSFFGKWLGAELAEINSYQDIDVIIPVPLHKIKQRKRGYNQVTGFGTEIATALKVPYLENVLLKTIHTDSQVFKSRLKRIQDDVIFKVENSELITNKHVLLVDDIVTTGATLENCATQLLNAANCKMSFATIAITTS